jgi:hypothetical protein
MANPVKSVSKVSEVLDETKAGKGRQAGRPLDGVYLKLDPDTRAALTSKRAAVEAAVGFCPDEAAMVLSLVRGALGLTGPVRK